MPSKMGERRLRGLRKAGPQARFFQALHLQTVAPSQPRSHLSVLPLTQLSQLERAVHGPECSGRRHRPEVQRHQEPSV